MNLRNFRIGSRLAFGFGTILAIMLAALVATNYLDDRSRAALGDALEGARAKETLAAEMRAVSLAQSSAMRNIALHSEIKQMQDEEARARKLGDRYANLVAQLGKRDLSAEERGIVEELIKIDKALDAPLLQALGMATSFRPEDAAKVLMADIDPLVQKTQDALERLIKLQDAANLRTIEAA